MFLNKFTQVQILRHFILHHFVFVAVFYFGSTFLTTWFNLPMHGVKVMIFVFNLC